MVNSCKLEAVCRKLVDVQQELVMVTTPCILQPHPKQSNFRLFRDLYLQNQHTHIFGKLPSTRADRVPI